MLPKQGHGLYDKRLADDLLFPGSVLELAHTILLSFKELAVLVKTGKYNCIPVLADLIHLGSWRTEVAGFDLAPHGIDSASALLS